MTKNLKVNNRASAEAGASPVDLFWQMSEEGTLVELPDSGLVVRLRPVSLAGLVRRGLMPNELYVEAMKGFPELNKNTANPTDIELGRMADMMLAADNFMYIVVELALLEPKLSLNPSRERGEIGWEMLAESDKYDILRLVQTPVRAWKRFLSEPDASVPVVADIDLLSHTA